jgi:hypothetical protein
VKTSEWPLLFVSVRKECSTNGANHTESHKSLEIVLFTYIHTNLFHMVWKSHNLKGQLELRHANTDVWSSGTKINVGQKLLFSLPAGAEELGSVIPGCTVPWGWKWSNIFSLSKFFSSHPWSSQVVFNPKFDFLLLLLGLRKWNDLYPRFATKTSILIISSKRFSASFLILM